MSHSLILLSALLSLAVMTDAEPREPRSDLIHSDLPLWVGEPVMWPHAFSPDDGSFGCVSRARFGDWRFEELSGGDPEWYRFANYGVFHCFMTVRSGNERAELASGKTDPSFLIELGTARGPNGLVELWALQRGSRPGSEYLLLARSPAPGAITAFDVLQRACPHDRMRRGPQLGILLTGYCAINSRRELIQLARRMARLPPLGRLALAAPEDGPDSETGGPAHPEPQTGASPSQPHN